MPPRGTALENGYTPQPAIDYQAIRDWVFVDSLHALEAGMVIRITYHSIQTGGSKTIDGVIKDGYVPDEAPDQPRFAIHSDEISNRLVLTAHNADLLSIGPEGTLKLGNVRKVETAVY